MTRRELIDRIKQHEAKYSRNLNRTKYFRVLKVVELADGVLAIMQAFGERSIYFDLAKCQIRKGSIEETRFSIHEFPTDTGLIDDGMSYSWNDIAKMAKNRLKSSGRRKIKWHKKLVKVEY